MRRVFLFTVFLFGCVKPNNSVLQYQDGRQLLTVNETDEFGQKITRPTVKMIAPDSIGVGQEYLAKIFLSDSDEDFVAAFTDCDLTGNLAIDTVTYQIDACQSKLFDEADTVIVAFKPQTPGVKTFQTIKIVTRDKHGVFRTVDHVFDYRVVKN